MNEELLDEWISKFKEFVNTEKYKEWNINREKKIKLYQKFLGREHIDKLTKEEWKQILNELWAIRAVFGNVSYRVNQILEKNDFEKVKRMLKYLLYGDDPLDKRYDSFVKNVFGFSSASTTEIMVSSDPTKYFLWNEVSRQALQYLGYIFPHHIKGKEYLEIRDVIDKIKIKLETALGRSIDYYKIDLFFLFASSEILKGKEMGRKKKNYFLVRQDDPMKSFDENRVYIKIPIDLTALTHKTVPQKRSEIISFYVNNGVERNKASKFADDILNFVTSVKLGDLVLIPNLDRGSVYMGSVISKIKYDTAKYNYVEIGGFREADIYSFPKDLRKTFRESSSLFLNLSRKRLVIDRILEGRRRLDEMETLTKFINSISITLGKRKELISDTKTIEVWKLIDKIREGEWAIPNFQRKFKWDHKKIRDLLESIAKGYYIGSFLIWDKPSKYGKFGAIGFAKPNDSAKLVLDGQQRITSIYYAISGGKDIKLWNTNRRYLFFINLKGFFDEDEDLIIYEDASKYEGSEPNDEILFMKLQFPFYKLSDRESWCRKFRKFVRNNNNKTNEDKFEDFYDYICDKLRSIWEYEIPYIMLSKDIELSEVVEIFERINTMGLTLSVFDLLNAKLSLKKIDLNNMFDEALKNEMIRRLKEFKYPVDIMLLQIIALMRNKTRSCRRTDLLNLGDIEDRDSFIEDWNSAVKYLIAAAEMLFDNREFGVFDKKYQPMTPTVTVLSALIWYLNENNLFTANNHNKIRMYYWSTLFTRRYVSATNEKMTNDMKEMIEWFNDDKEIPSVVKKARSEIDALNLLEVKSKNDSVFSAIINMLNVNGARDWIRGETIKEVDAHHIFPKSIFRGSSVNSILNFTLLHKSTNREFIGNKKPSEYIREIISEKYGGDESKFKEILKPHFIDDLAYEALLNDDFETFVKEREKLIKRKMKELVGLQEDFSQKIIVPNDPYGNELAFIETIKQCVGDLRWLDKYFSRKGLDILYKALNENKEINSIKVILSVEKLNDNFYAELKKFRGSMRNRNIDFDVHVITDNKVKRKIHDRWLISDSSCFNIPSPDIVARGQYSEIHETDCKEPKNVFEEIWKSSEDLFDNWSKLKGLIS